MKRFILKILLLLFPIIVLAVSMEYLLQHIPNDYIYKKNYLDKHSKEIEILILGSSQEYYGVNPVYFSQNTFNASHVSQTLDLSSEIFKIYQNDFSNLDVIIVSSSYFGLWSKLENASDSWRMKNYAIYYGIDTKSLKDHSELLNNTLGNNFKRLYKYYLKKENEIYWSKLGWGTAYKAVNGENLEETGKAAALRHTIDIYSKESMKIFAENMQILNLLAEFCNNKNVKLIFLTTPTYYIYRENINKNQLNKMVETMNDFVAKHNNCYYINWFENPDFVKEDYYDADHLDEIGAEKLSKKLAFYVDSLMISNK